jgi:hypothetical protein
VKEYPKIPAYVKFLGQECTAFYKHDGSNLRVEMSKKRGWYKWGTRHRLFNASDPEYGCAIDIFEKKYAEPLEKLIRDNFPRLEGAMAFMEFRGPHSFGGQHEPKTLNVPNNDPKDVILFDVNITKKGFVSPKKFIKTFGSLHIPEVIYQGVLDEDFVKKVREKHFPVDEGVVCKGDEGHKLWFCKIKTWDYLKKIQGFFGSSWGEHWE